MNTIQWQLKSFDELSAKEVYEIIRLRIAIFVVEQNCPYQDADRKDQKAFHLMGFLNNELVAYARILPPGVSYPDVSIGRVVSSSDVRGKGVGKLLMKQALDEIKIKFEKTSIRISAQSYLIKFYSSFGFKSVGEEYLEDNIPHQEMLLEKLS
ncbi:MAG: GNAT family N-acetyltransferase [Bacteroidia bacterium]|nr:GNAT family N-acetyltransferase [Bacteroidia bacterium]